MKKLLFTILVLFLIACTQSKTPPKLFSASMLALQQFEIDVDKDTTLTTLHGTLVRIQAGSFSTDKTATIEIREAFTAAEILAAGMVTESNGRPLQSGGMIYINASENGNALNLVKPIKVSLPNQYFDSAMQVFKGAETDSGTVNWIDPAPVDTTPQSQKWEKGKTLFQSKCRSCHSIFFPLTGPALANVENRWPEKAKLYEWIRNNGRLIASGYPRAREISKYSPSTMVLFEGVLSTTDIDAILAYIKNETLRPGAREEAKRVLDSFPKPDYFPKDTGKYDVLEFPQRPSDQKDSGYFQISKSDQSFFEEPVPQADDTDTIKTEQMEWMRKGFNDSNPTAGMYDFEVTTLGWYNIDLFVEGYQGATIVTLTAELTGKPKLAEGVENPMYLYLFCPANKSLSVGSTSDGKKYSFVKIGGGIPLFKGSRAILFAFGSEADRMYYGLTEFKIQDSQHIKVSIKETMEEEIRKALLSRQLDGIDLDIKKKRIYPKSR